MKREAFLADGPWPLTYCSNVHPSGNLAEAEAVYRDLVAPTLRRNLGPGLLCLGAWWPADLALALAKDQAVLEKHGDLLEELGLVPSSINVFPLGRFHGAGVKEKVYEPDWSSEVRLEATLAAGLAAAKLCRRLGVKRAVMSTLPLGFRGVDRRARPGPEHVRNIFRMAIALAAIADQEGVHVELALEPEPWCMLESIEECVTWLSDEAMGFAAKQGDEAKMRRHIGICIDLCHAAVIGEDSIKGYELAVSSGIRVGKIQLSVALKARGEDGLQRLRAYDEPVYLHQTWSRMNGAGPFLDLGSEALQGYEAAEEEEFVSHFHVPLFFEGDHPLASSRAELLTFLDFVRDGKLAEGLILEVETYTNPQIADELAFARHYLRNGVAKSYCPTSRMEELK